MGLYILITWFSKRSSNTLLKSLTNICPFGVTMHGTKRKEYEWQSDEYTYLADAIWKTISY